MQKSKRLGLNLKIIFEWQQEKKRAYQEAVADSVTKL